jgi:hypothetical protein
MTNKLYMTGSVTSNGVLPKEVIRILENAMKLNREIILADSYGFESQVQQYLSNKKYPHVTIYYARPDRPKVLKSHRWQTEKVLVDPHADHLTREIAIANKLSDDCSIMFAMWNKQSSFIRTSMLRTLQQDKPVAVYTFGEPHPTRQFDTPAQFYEAYPNHDKP